MSRHLSDDPFTGSNGSPFRLSRSTSRPLVMTTSSTNSLCSSSTLLPNSPSNSEITDLEQDDLEDVLSDHDPFDPPLVSISSCESTDPSSVSVYESPLSSMYEVSLHEPSLNEASFVESPTTSSMSYATPMERSPWASPQSSIKSRSPLLSVTSPTFSVKSPTLMSPPSNHHFKRSPPSIDLSVRRTESVQIRVPTLSGEFKQGDSAVPERG
jgi:hypothetical protein